jgi:hypothetical protein
MGEPTSSRYWSERCERCVFTRGDHAAQGARCPRLVGLRLVYGDDPRAVFTMRSAPQEGGRP